MLINKIILKLSDFALVRSELKFLQLTSHGLCKVIHRTKPASRGTVVKLGTYARRTSTASSVFHTAEIHGTE